MEANLLANKALYTDPVEAVAVKKSLSKEQLRFESHGDASTVFKMSIGPLVYQVGVALHDALDLFLISCAFDSEKVQIVSFSSVIRFLSMSVAIFFNQACVGRVTGLVGEGRRIDAAKVIADLVRLSFFSMLIIPVIFYYCAKPILLYMGCSEQIAQDGRDYLLPILLFMPLTSMFQLSCGIIQSEGRSILAGLLQISAFVLNCGFFSPILLFGFKIPFRLAGLSFALSQAIPGIFIISLIFSGKFDTEAQWKMLLGKPIQETWDGIKIASPFILNVIAGTIPPMVMINLMMKMAALEGISGQVGTIYSVLLKIQPIVNSFSIGLGQGLLGAGSYASGAGQYKRLVKMFSWILGVSITLQMVFVIIIMIAPRQIASIWVSDQQTLALSSTFLRIPFYTNWLTAVNESFTSFLLCLGNSWRAMSPSLLRGILYIAYAYVVLCISANSHSMMYVYNANDLSVFLLDILIIIGPMKHAIHIFNEEPKTDNSGYSTSAV